MRWLTGVQTHTDIRSAVTWYLKNDQETYGLGDDAAYEVVSNDALMPRVQREARKYATATLLAPVASAHEPTNTSTAPYPNLPNRPPNDDAPAPASSSNPEATGPTITETLRASDIP